MRRSLQPLLKQVTLIVYGWHGNEPGTLAWVFPSLGSAVAAVRALKNAVKWLIVAGKPVERRDGDEVNVDEMRRSGLVLLERFV